MEPYLIAIVFVKEPGDRYSAKKYIHNIKNTSWYVGKFCGNMKRKFPTAEYVNFYLKGSGTFKEKIYLE